MKKTIEVQLKEIHEKVDSSHKKKDWYYKLGKIVDVYEKTMVPHWFDGMYFLKGTVCFICMDEGHLIDFDCHTIYKFLNQPKN